MSGSEVTNHLVAQLLAEATVKIGSFHLIIDESEQAKQLALKMKSVIINELKNRGMGSKCEKVTPRDSKKDLCLQLADMIARMVMDSNETGSKSLIKIIEKKLVITTL